MKRLWKKVRYRLEWLAMKAALKFVPLISRRTCMRVGDLLGSLAFALDPQGRRVTTANLQAAFGDRYTPKERERIAAQSYRYFARTMTELFWSPRLTRENYTDYLEFDGLERMLAQTSAADGYIAGVFHYGNFEWLGLATGWVGFPCAITTQELKNPLLDPSFQRLRERSGHTTVSRDGAIIRLFKVVRRKGSVALLVDTTLPPHHPTVVIDCFGLKTIVTVAHAWLQERTGAPIVPLYCEPQRDGRYRIVIQAPIKLQTGATHQEIAQACWDSFEPVVRQQPAPWMWMYKHWRYRPAGATDYPFYARESWAFDQAAARRNYAKLDRQKRQRGTVPR